MAVDLPTNGCYLRWKGDGMIPSLAITTPAVSLTACCFELLDRPIGSISRAFSQYLRQIPPGWKRFP